ncbi:MAG TPA: TadE family protein, partial [Magnetospirillum sp.]|nr:TadE family protein [Magnetospirillum sp.]
MRPPFPLSPARDERGAAAVELALMLPMLAVLLAGIVDLGRAVWLHQAAVKAARDSVRFLTRVPTPWSNVTYQTQATNLARTGSLAGDTPLLAPNVAAAFSYPTEALGGLAGS